MPHRRILVVEDELMLAWSLGEVLDEAGYEVVGPHNSLKRGLEAALHDDLSAAVLDVNLRGERVFPIASILASRGIPFVFLTGYGPGAIPGRFSRVKILSKPSRPLNLLATLDSLCG